MNKSLLAFYAVIILAFLAVLSITFDYNPFRRETKIEAPEPEETVQFVIKQVGERLGPDWKVRSVYSQVGWDYVADAFELINWRHPLRESQYILYTLDMGLNPHLYGIVIWKKNRVDFNRECDRLGMPQLKLTGDTK